MRIGIVVVFLNEARYLPTLLESMAAQNRPPDQLLLVDDGSVDDSAEIARAFARDHRFTKVLRRPTRPAEPDRLTRAPELLALQWAVDHLGDGLDVVAKIDADLRLTPEVVAEMERRFAADPELGIAGARLSEVGKAGHAARLPGRPEHVHGATKFYRWECYRQIVPIPAIHGWDMVDEVKARSLGWRTASFSIPGGDPLHLRPMGAHDGRLRGFRRWGAGDYAAGVHPVVVIATGLKRLGAAPPALGALNYLLGWSLAGARRVPRVDPAVRAFARLEQRQRVQRRVASWVRGRPTPT
jgi:glycosyltransferase involved in cell wall biosynthesis